MTPVDRLALADQLSADVVALAVAGIQFERPDATTNEVRHELLDQAQLDAASLA